ncbi:Hypothetical predicted protein [Podarcis lilfordi]|uniref:Uncharacterized protein n=1 Tax=Podarcis lilfordi TaxID=74358 RepID=A0AA35K7I7_9SAUR|nr:Hypothetical predicted protein [Podarcis lilfordi]
MLNRRGTEASPRSRVWSKAKQEETVVAGRLPPQPRPLEWDLHPADPWDDTKLPARRSRGDWLGVASVDATARDPAAGQIATQDLRSVKESIKESPR